MPEDITTTGPVGLKGLKGIDRTKQLEEAYSSRPLEERLAERAQSKAITPQEAHLNTLLNSIGNYTPISTGQDFGSSRFDKPILLEDEVSQIAENRALKQSGFEQIGLGAVKMGTTAATTFLDSTLGLIYGLATGVGNTLDNDPKTTFIRGLWDNEFNKAMASIQEKMEEVAPNYYTQEQLESPWYSAANLLSANFWGDKFLKNMGFTMGAMATMAVPGFNGAWIAKGISGAGRALNVGGTALKGFNTGGKVAQRVANTLVSASGEGMIEAVNAVQDNRDSEVANLENARNQAVQDANAWYQEHRYDIPREGQPSSYQAYMDRLSAIDEEYKAGLAEIDNGMRNVGNSVYLANLLILSLTNNLEFGKYLKGGYNMQRGFAGLDMMTKEGKTESLKEFGKALARGEGGLAAAEGLGKVSPLGATARTIGRAATEGFEEGTQRLTSDTEQMKEQARVNVWSHKTGDSFYAKGINPDITDELVDRYKAMHAAWNASFGDASSSGWEEVLLGALTGGIGTFGVKSQRDGRTKLGWQGGFYEEFISKPKERIADAEKLINIFNERFATDEARKRTAHAITAMSLTEEMDSFLMMGDVLNYKNKELAAVVNDALFYRDNGALDAYISFYKELAQNISDEDIEVVKNELKLVNRGQSPYDNYSNDDIREILKDKAQSTYDKIQTTLDYHNENMLRYYEKALNSAKNVYNEDLNIPGGVEALAENAIRELTAKEVLLWDLMRRKEEIQKDIDNMSESTKAIRGIAREEKAIKDIDKAIEKNTKEYEELKNFDSNIKDIQRQYQLALIRRAVKDGDGLKTVLLEASNLQEVADAYFSSTDQYRQNVFDEAVAESEGDQKTLLESFKPFLGAINGMEDAVIEAVDKAFPDAEEMTDDDIVALESQRAFISARIGDMLDSVIRNYVYDADKDYSKYSLIDAIRDLAENPKIDDSVASILKDVADSLEINETLYKAAEPRPKETEEENEEEMESEDGVLDDEDALDDMLSGAQQGLEEDEEEDEVEPDTTIVKDRGKAISYLKRYFKKSFGDDFDKVIDILNQDNPSDEDRAFVEEKLSAKKYDKFKKTFFRDYVESPEEPAEDSEEAFTNGDELPAPDGTLDDANKEREKRDSEENPNLSVRANSFRPYLIGTANGNGLAAGIASKALEHAKNKEYYRNWYALPFANGIDYIINNYLQQIIDVAGEEGKLKVYYAKYYDDSGIEASGVNNPHIMLVTPYNDKVKSVLSPNAAIANNIITYNKRKYLVVGAYGYSTGAKDLQKAQDAISSAIDLQRNSKTTSGKSFDKNWEVLKEGVDGAWTNYIYEVSPGYVIYKNTKDDTGDVSLKSVLADINNPLGVKVENIPFSIWKGDEENTLGIHEEFFKFKGAHRYDEKSEHYPGQVYLWMPTSDGKYVPVAVAPLSFIDINADDNGPLYSDIEKAIFTIANNRKDPKKITAAISVLRGTDDVPGLLIFSTKHEKGTQIIYSEESNEILFTKNGEYLDKKINLNSNASSTDIYNEFIDLLKETNPRVAIHQKTLLERPQYYLDSNVLMVNARHWGTVNARAYAYPVNTEGRIPSEFKPSSERVVTKRTTEIELSVFIGNSKYVVIDGVLYNNRLTEVTDPDTLRYYADIKQILDDGMAPVDLGNKGKYYLIGNRAYHYTRSGHYNPLSSSEIEVLRDNIAKAKAKEELESGKGKLIQEANKIKNEIERLENQLKRPKSSKKNWEPANLHDLVIQEMLSLFETGQKLNYQDVLNEVGSGLRTEISKWTKGKNAIVSKDGKLSVQGFAETLQEASTIGDFEQQDIRREIIDVLRNYSGRVSLKEAMKQSMSSFNAEEIRYSISRLEERLNEISKEIADIENGGEESNTDTDITLEDLIGNFEEEAKAGTPQVKVPLSKLPSNTNENGFANQMGEFVLGELTPEEDGLLERIASKYGNDANVLEDKIKNSSKSEIRELYSQVKDVKSLKELLEKIDKCGL